MYKIDRRGGSKNRSLGQTRKVIIFVCCFSTKGIFVDKDFKDECCVVCTCTLMEDHFNSNNNPIDFALLLDLM